MAIVLLPLLPPLPLLPLLCSVLYLIMPYPLKRLTFAAYTGWHTFHPD